MNDFILFMILLATMTTCSNVEKLVPGDGNACPAVSSSRAGWTCLDEKWKP